MRVIFPTRWFPCLAAAALSACGASPARAPEKTVFSKSAVSLCSAPPSDQARISFGESALVPICRDVYVDPDTPDNARLALRVETPRAWSTIAEAFGSITAPPPVVIYCRSPACIADFAGPTRRSRVVEAGQKTPGTVYSSKDRKTVIMGFEDGAEAVLVHELVHIEMLNRLNGAFVPDWFSEGLAFSIANQRTECGRAPRAIDDLRRLDHGFGDFTNLNLQKRMVAAYCQAGSDLDAWLHRRGRKGMLELLDSVKAGRSFYDAYGPMLTQSSDSRAASDTNPDHEMVLENAAVDSITLEGRGDSFVRTKSLDLADKTKPFSFALWVRSSGNSGTLVHVSSNDDGSGWCTPFLGFDGEGRVVAQVIHGTSSDESQYSIAKSSTPIPLGQWVHVAMTWAPNGSVGLYIGGMRVADTEAATYNGRGVGTLLHITWGSSNEKGADSCFKGAIRPGGFKGSVRGMSVYGRELTAAEITALAQSPVSG